MYDPTGCWRRNLIPSGFLRRSCQSRTSGLLMVRQSFLALRTVLRVVAMPLRPASQATSPLLRNREDKSLPDGIQSPDKTVNCPKSSLCRRHGEVGREAGRRGRCLFRHPVAEETITGFAEVGEGNNITTKIQFVPARGANLKTANEGEFSYGRFHFVRIRR